MTRFVAFLRAINVGGHTVRNEQLVSLCTEAGLEAVSTFLASGNVLFSSSQKASTLERVVARHLEDALGYPVTTFVRSAAEVQALAASSPFGETAAKTTLHVGFLHAAPSAAACRSVAALSNDTDRLTVVGREVYWLIHGGFSDATVKDKDILRALGGVETTWRNMNTVRRLAQKLS